MTNSDNWVTMNPSEYAAYNGIKDTDNICECDFCELKNDSDNRELPCGCVPEDFCKCEIV